MYISYFISLVFVSFGKILSVDSGTLFSSGFEAFKASTCYIPWSTSACYIPWSSIVFIGFSNALPWGEYVNVPCSIILLWSNGNISSPWRYSYLSILLDDNAYISVVSLLISYCNFKSLILSSIAMIIFYILAKRFFLKHEELSNAKVVSLTKKE